MRSVALLPSIALLAGVWAGLELTRPVDPLALSLVLLAAVGAWSLRRDALATIFATAGYVVAGATLGADAAARALSPPLCTVLAGEIGGFGVATAGPPSVQEPVLVRIRLTEDAARVDFGVSIRAEVERITIGRREHVVTGGVRLTIGGNPTLDRVGEWRAGRRLEVPVTFRRPARYLNEGVADFERDLALDGVALNASAKSELLVNVVQRGNAFEELAADVRAHVRRAVGRWIGPHDARAAGIVTAILIGDRTGLPDEVRARLQAAGTYHVIAISGGNIAIFAALIAGVVMIVGVSGRASAAAIITGLLAYAAVVNGGPSVWRATATAVAYLAARLVDHRSPPWNAMAVSAAVLATVTPLDVRDVGFALTFGATAAILEAATRVHGALPERATSGVGSQPVASRVAAGVASGVASAFSRTIASWLLASVAASLAAEIVLMPIGAVAFSRVTIAGLILNLLAIPLMTIAQIAGLGVALTSGVEWLASAIGTVAALAATGLVDSARLVDVVPWLAVRVPPPAPMVVIAYYIALSCALWCPRARALGALATAVGWAVILSGGATPARDPSRLRLTVHDVGQGEAMLLDLPGGRHLMVDAGGAGADGGAFDIGGRVLAPALWARGIRRLDVLAITHGDPDHAGGAPALIHDFVPAVVWEGVPVPRHALLQRVREAARNAGLPIEQRLAGDQIGSAAARVRVLHPPRPDWERQRVRNDDSLVLEVRYRDVAMLLTGDIGVDIERALIPQLSPARIRILKVAHHGSRTSTSQELLDAWRPQIAVISCGRGNRFGHPAPEVVRRLELARAQILRTDRDGQITIDTDGHTLSIRTYQGGRQ